MGQPAVLDFSPPTSQTSLEQWRMQLENGGDTGQGIKLGSAGGESIYFMTTEQAVQRLLWLRAHIKTDAYFYKITLGIKSWHKAHAAHKAYML